MSLKRVSKCLFLIVVFIASAFNLKSQCPLSSIILIRQSQVDSFRILYPNCIDLRSTLRIGFERQFDFLTQQLYCPTFSDITNVDSLMGIKSIFGHLEISCNKVLKNLRGLDSIHTVRRTIRIEGNENLRYIANLPRLNTIGERLVVVEKNINRIELPSIRDTILDVYLSSEDTLRPEFLSRINYFRVLDLSGPLRLENLLNIERIRTFRINQNSLISNLSSLRNSKIKNINVISLINCPNLVNTDGLPKLDSLTLLSIQNSPLDFDFLGNNSAIKLASIRLSGIPNMADLHWIKDVEISSGLNINDNPDLQSLNGLNPKSTINYCLNLTGNPVLKDISALNSVNVNNIACIGYGIMDNPKLEVCNYPVICNFIQNNPGRLNIRNNASGCNSEAEILEACAMVSTQDESDIPTATFTLYPNPAHDWVMIRGAAEIHRVRLLDMMGRQLKYTSSDRLDLTDIPAGMYVVQVRDVKGTIHAEKLILTK